MARVESTDVLRFGLELAALASLTYWGLTANTGVSRVVLAVGLPLIAAAAWGPSAYRGPGRRDGRRPRAGPAAA